MESFSSESDTAVPIDKDVLERLSKSCRAERIAWACSVAYQYREHTLTYVRLLSRPRAYATIEDLRADEARLVQAVRKGARHANFALDELDAERADGERCFMARILGNATAVRVEQISPEHLYVVPVKPRARGL